MFNKTANERSKGVSLIKTIRQFGLDGFVLVLIAMVFLAYLWPEGGTGTGRFSLSRLANYGVSGIFFFYGLTLNRSKLRAGLGNWRLHFLVQCSTFILFPVLILPFRNLFQSDDLHLLWLGTFFLASLPSTVSSSVVMVSLAQGNIPAAIFNASLSSLLGVFITPLWMSLVMTSSGADLPLNEIFPKLIIQVLLPVALGMLLNKRLGYWAGKHRKTLKYFDQSVILVIVYTSFSKSFEEKMFTSIGVLEIAMLVVAMLALFFLVYVLIRWLGRSMLFSMEDQVTAVFCGSKKSLVHGTVMAKVLFTNSTLAGILLLPLMIYHALQLIAASILANRIVKNNKV